jgi:hypothetical protein
MDVDEEWAQQIRMRKFEIYNEEWMQAIEEDAQLEAYYDGGGDEADLEARIGVALLSISTSVWCLVHPLTVLGASRWCCAGMQQHDLDMMGEYDGMDPMMQHQMRQVQMMRAQGLDPYAGMDIDQQEMMERQ